jgi:inner membrane protein
MMSITHSTIAAAGVSLILGTADPLPLGLAILGSQLPDLDTTQSLIGQVCYPISSWIEDRFPHRSVTHSLLATATLAALSIGIGQFWLSCGWKVALALPLGHLLACFSDCFTKQGVQLFWPEPAWAISVSNPRRRLTTGGASELWVLAIASACLCLGVYFANGGGVTAKVTQGLGLRDGAIATYNQNAASQQVWANIEGVFGSDRTKADGKYFILDTAGNEFIVVDRNGNLYQTNQQIVATKITTEVGTTVQTQIQTLTFDDEEAVPKLQQVRSQFPNAAIFITGDLQIDFPEDVEIPVQTGYPKTAVTGSTLKLSYEGVEKAISYLTDQYAIGSLQVKIISPAPVWN